MSKKIHWHNLILNATYREQLFVVLCPVGVLPVINNWTMLRAATRNVKGVLTPFATKFNVVSHKTF